MCVCTQVLLIKGYNGFVAVAVFVQNPILMQTERGGKHQTPILSEWWDHSIYNSHFFFPGLELWAFFKLPTVCNSVHTRHGVKAQDCYCLQESTGNTDPVQSFRLCKHLTTVIPNIFFLTFFPPKYFFSFFPLQIGLLSITNCWWHVCKMSLVYRITFPEKWNPPFNVWASLALYFFTDGFFVPLPWIWSVLRYGILFYPLRSPVVCPKCVLHFHLLSKVPVHFRLSRCL